MLDWRHFLSLFLQYHPFTDFLSSVRPHNIRRRGQRWQEISAREAGHFNHKWSQAWSLFSINSQIMLRLCPKDMTSTPSWAKEPSKPPFLFSIAIPTHIQPPYLKHSSRAPSAQSTSSFPNWSSRLQSFFCPPHIPAHSNCLQREVPVILVRSRPIMNNRLLTFCCPGNQASNTQVPKQSGPPSSSPGPPTFHFSLPLIRHLGQPSSCLLQAVSCQNSRVIIPHPSQNVSSYSFLTTNPDSNDLQLYDVPPTVWNLCFSCLLPLQSITFHPLLFTSLIFQGLLH